MKILSENFDDCYFLQGGGAMGELIRATDWSKTALGDPKKWPQGLRTTVAIMLDNPFGMYIAWGSEYIQLYNDGYRPILGTTKHPQALGISTRQTFEEIWHIIGPMFDSVMKGDAVRSHDLMLPLNRHGFVEECYFDFSYSPIRTGDGKVGGVLVTVIETTEKKKALDALKESEQLLRSVIESAPIPIGVYVGKDMRIEFANQSILNVYGKGNNVIGKSYKKILPELENQQLFQQLDDVYTSGIPFHAKNQRVDIEINGKLQPFYFNYSFMPLFDSTGKVFGVMNTGTDVTDLNMAKLKIQESENKLRNTILQAPIAMCIFMGPEHVVELANERMFELWGKPAEAFLNKPLFEGLFEAKGQGFEELLDSVYQTGETVAAQGIPVTLPRAGTLELVYVDVLYQAYRDEKDLITGILAVAVDVTAQVIARKKVEEAEEKARLAIHSAELGVYELDYSSDEVITDKRFKEMFGISDPVSHHEYIAAIHPDDLLHREQAHKKSLTSGQLDYQARIIRKDKSIRWLRLTGKVIFDESNNPLKLIGVGQDITPSMVAQKKVEESERSIRNMVLQAPVAMCILRGPSYMVDIANHKMFELWGKNENEVLGKPLFEGLAEARAQGFEQILQEVLTTGERFVASERPVNLPRNGKIETVYINFVYEAMKTEDDSISGILAVAIDVTPQVIARHRIEEVVAERTKDLAEANSNLQKSNAELAQFAYIASHDLQEPLRKITTFAQMLENALGNKLDDHSKNYLNKINNSSARMNTLIRDVLTYSELVKEKEVFSEVDLNQIMESTKNDYELLIDQKGAIINCSDLPVIEAIPLQMAQLFGNMIGNALKFVRKDIIPVITIMAIKVSKEELKNLSLKKNVDYYKIQFSDNGIGIKPEYTVQIFNIFQRLHRKSEFEGTGIGLAMCKKIALNHHGDINAVGSSEKGAVFNVILPSRQS